MTKSVVSSFKTQGANEAQPSVLGLDTTRIVNFVNSLKNFTVYLSILTLMLQVILAQKVGRKI